MSEYLIDISTFRNHLVVNQWLTIPKWIFSLFSLASNPLSQRFEFYGPFFFSFAFINNQPKQMVIFKSLPILSFHISYKDRVFWESILLINLVSLSLLISFSHFLITASVSSFYLLLWLYFIGLILVDHIRSRDMKIGEDRRDMFEARFWSFSFINSV